MRILHVLDHSIPLHSGYTFRTRAILEQQRALGWETFHVTGPKHVTDVLEEQVDGLDFFRTPEANGTLSRMPALNQLAVINALEKRIDEVVQQVHPDVLHAHSPALNGAAAVRVARRRGLPLVYEVRALWEDAAVDHGTGSEWGLRYRLTRALESWVLQRADAVTTICEGLRGEIISRGIAPGNVTVIPNAVNVDRFQIQHRPDPELVDQFGLAGKSVLGFIGSFYAYEGLDLLLRALPEIRAAIPEAVVLLVGGGPQEEQLRARVTGLNIGNRVFFTGRVPHDSVQRYYSLVNVFVYPRLPMRLTNLVTPLKPLEAMAQGKLVVASDVGGHLELMRPRETGELFKAGDPAALADAVRRILSKPDDWPRRIAAGRRFVEEERNWPVSVARYRQVYAPLVRVEA